LPSSLKPAYFDWILAEAILNMLPTPRVKVQPSYRHVFKVEIEKILPTKKDLIAYKSPEEIFFLMCLTGPRLSSNQQILELVKDLRGGNLGIIGTTPFLVVIILIFSMTEGFVLYIVHNLNSF
jgi:hypothetical protein